MAIHRLAGKPAPQELLIDIDKLRHDYYARKPDITDSAQRVSFGTSGRRFMNGLMRRPRRSKKRCCSSFRRRMSKYPSLPVTRLKRSLRPRPATARPSAA